MQMNETQSFTLETNAPVRGLMRVSKYLRIHTRSAEIMANITLAYEGSPISVFLDTGHAPIGAIVKVVNLPKKPKDPDNPYSISISACTTAAPVSVAVDYAYSYPPVSLQLNAETSLSPVMVRVPPSFQGSFVCRAQGSIAQVSETPGVKDPSGANVSRAVIISKGHPDEPRDHELGTASWNDLPDDLRKQLHSVDIQSSSASAVLVLDGPDSRLVQGIYDWPLGWHLHP